MKMFFVLLGQYSGTVLAMFVCAYVPMHILCSVS